MWEANMSFCTCLWLELVPTYFTNILNHTWSVGLWNLNCIIVLFKSGNTFTVSLSIALYFNYRTVFAWRRLSKRTVMSMNGYFGNSSKTPQAVNARCIFSNLRMGRDTRSWINEHTLSCFRIESRTLRFCWNSGYN